MTYSEDYVRKFQDSLDWWEVVQETTLSEPFLLEFRDKLNRDCWTTISESYVLSQDFIIECKDYLDWAIVYEHQDVPFEFIQKHFFKQNDCGVYQVSRFNK